MTAPYLSSISFVPQTENSVPSIGTEFKELLALPRFRSRIPEDRRAAVEATRVVAFGRRIGENSYRLVYQPGDEQVHQDIIALLGLGATKPQVYDRLHHATYGFRVSKHSSLVTSVHTEHPLDPFQRSLEAYVNEESAKSEFELVNSHRQFANNEYWLSAALQGDPLLIYNAITAVPQIAASHNNKLFAKYFYAV
jgi:hypothetical protein